MIFSVAQTGQLRQPLHHAGAGRCASTTGTPPGVGMGRRDAAGQPAPVFLKAGDVMTLGIDGLGQQRQRVVAFRADAPATGR
jgi:hypothetical protein